MIGIIFKSSRLMRIVNNQEKTENVEYYYNLAKENKIDLFLYTIHQLFPHSPEVQGYLFSYNDQVLREAKVTIPKVNLIRTIFNKRNYTKLKNMKKKYDVEFINLTTERNKYTIYQYLKCKENIKDYIPDTDQLTYKQLKHYLNTYAQIIIKPINGSQGRNIFSIEKQGKKIIAHYTRQKTHYKRVFTEKSLATFYKKFFKNPSKYLLQQWIDFRKYEGEKFDIRTSVQKDKNGVWKVTGIVSRVAGKNGIVTNIAQGGRAVAFKDTKPLLQEHIDIEIDKISIEIAKELEKLHTSTADLGLDLAIDEEHKLWFIEANYCDLRYAYREANDLEMWQASYRFPFEYAYSQYNKLVSIDKEATKVE